MPANLYGPNDRYHPTDSHVLPAMIRRLHEAKARGASHVECWGSGSPLREFLHADDLARAVILLMETYSGEAFVNVGSGDELSIRDVAELVRDVVGFRGKMTWDASKPDGTPRKVLDSSKLRGMGWRPEVPLRQGIEGAYADFLQRFASHGAPASSAS